MSQRFARARKPAEKEARRAALLATARAMLEAGVDVRALSLNELARQAGMAKSNVYRYFETREAVLIALLWDELTAWRQAVAVTRVGPQTVDALVRGLAHSFADRQLLCMLTAALPSVLEQNLSEEAIASFKRATLGLFADMATELAARAPGLPAQAYVQLLEDGGILIAGLYPFAHPTATAARVLQTAEFSAHRRDLGRDLARFMAALAGAMRTGDG